MKEKSTVEDSMNCSHASPLHSPNSRNHSKFLGMDMEKDTYNPSNCFDQVPKTQQIAVPTTFVQADTSSFRELVQKLTGISDETQEKLPITMPARYSSRAGVGGGKQLQAEAAPPSSCSKVEVGPRKSTFKLQERRQSMRKLEIQLGLTSLRLNPLSPSRSGEIRSPNVIDLHSLHVPSPISPLGSDPFYNVNGYSPSSTGTGTPNAATPTSESSEEEKAIAEKGFYLHPSPRLTPRGSDPEAGNSNSVVKVDNLGVEHGEDCEGKEYDAKGDRNATNKRIVRSHATTGRGIVKEDEKSCVFCDIIRGRAPAVKLHEDETCLCILDINPLSHGHSLVISKTHFSSLEVTPPAVAAAMCAVVPVLGNAIMKATCCDSFNLLVNSGASAGQEIFHTHFHIIPRSRHDELWRSENDRRRPLCLNQETAVLADCIRGKLSALQT